MGDADLFFAARTGDTARVAYLLEVCGAEADAQDEWQATPLFYASLCGHTEVVRILLRAGAKCEVRCVRRSMQHACVCVAHERADVKRSRDANKRSA
jgi:ankyrin repeat protein